MYMPSTEGSGSTYDLELNQIERLLDLNANFAVFGDLNKDVERSYSYAPAKFNNYEGWVRIKMEQRDYNIDRTLMRWLNEHPVPN